MDRRIHQHTSEFLAHDFGCHILLLETTVDLGRDHDGIWRRNERVPRYRAYDILKTDFSRECTTMEDSRAVITVPYIDCGKRKNQWLGSRVG